MANSRSILDATKRLVVKIGSSLLVDDQGALRQEWMAAFAADIATLKARGTQIVIISSGAISVGRRVLDLAAGPRNRALRLEESQAAAATGQIRLAHAWQEALARLDIHVAQILLTLDDTEDRRRFLNARSTIDTLLTMGVVPVVNENDTVATDEIRFGDNDRLAARVAQMIGADTCVLLTDIDGLYTADPNVDDTAQHVGEITAITPDIEAMAGARLSADGSGGMITKLEAARIAMGAGCRLGIAGGHEHHPLGQLMDGARCSWFLPSSEPQTARKQWIAAGLSPSGSLAVDAGAAKALRGGKSLLPAGVVEVTGRFTRGDMVTVLDLEGTEIARGLSAYSAEDARRILGHKSGEIEALLGYRGREEMIHRDNLVLR
ncbi:MAG: glutamate 5-kinase [Alphaproteobacteria bacterium]|nr:glutamate 5-kinase [Alphaproteobacteria bacterium]